MRSDPLPLCCGCHLCSPRQTAALFALRGEVWPYQSVGELTVSAASALSDPVPLRHTAMVRAHPTMMPRKANAAIATPDAPAILRRGAPEAYCGMRPGARLAPPLQPSSPAGPRDRSRHCQKPSGAGLGLARVRVNRVHITSQYGSTELPQNREVTMYGITRLVTVAVAVVYSAMPLTRSKR